MATVPFATVADLEKRWREFEDDEIERVETLLLDASMLVLAECRGGGVGIESVSDEFESILRSVTCNVTRRAFSSIGHGQAVSAYSQGAIGITESYTYANPSGDMYLTKTERKLLGISSSGGARSLHPHIDGGEPCRA